MVDHLYGRQRGVKSKLAVAAQAAFAAGAAWCAGAALAQTADARPANEPAAAATATLPLVTATEQSDSIDAPPPAIRGGQVGRGARMGILGNASVMETPFSVTSYTAQTIENDQARSVADVLSADPSVRMGSARSNLNEDITIRGFSVPSSDFALNGVFGVTPYWRAPLEAVERVEIIKGPSASLFGMTPGGSVGGVVNLVPKRAESEPITRFTGSASSDSVFGGHVDIGRRFGPDGSFGVRINAMQREGDTAIKGQSTRESLGAVALDYRGRALRASLDLLAQKERIDNVVRQFQAGPTLAAVPRAPDNRYPYPGLGWSDGRNGSAVLKAEYDLSDSLTAYASYGQRKLNWGAVASNPVIMDTAGNYSFFGGWQRMSVESKSLDAGLRGRFSTGPVKHEVALNFSRLEQEQTLGFYTGYPGGSSNLYAGLLLPTPSTAGIGNPLRPYLDTKLTSLALADTLSFMDDRLRVTLGLRRQQVAGQDYDFSTGQASGAYYDESATTPVAGVVYKLQPNVSLYASYIEGLSRGEVAPISAAISNPGAVMPPYKSKQKEIGVKFDLDGGMVAAVSLFELTKPSAGLSGSTFGVFGEQRNRGVEATLAGELVRGVRVLGGVTYMDGVITKAATSALEGKKAIGVPDWQLNLGAEWDMPFLPGLTLTGRMIHTGKTAVDPANTLHIPGWNRFDAGARYATRLGGKPVTFRMNVENLFDKDYWGTSTAGYLFVGSPRTVSLSASIDF
ncbi:TonB-dependent receptor [Variovorax beijingensis]|uniref:TonB-dependent receptor n=1 Tax=Variovorax beijingensis TaxID=2496117 RepID=A0ABY0A0B4_9BURK|nr:TonB-dependent receptor [Variovorax beijingensis]RSZ30521.1 TonB-dependent receptor [Variovorax beijingensis]